jgi:hypothetical protein
LIEAQRENSMSTGRKAWGHGQLEEDDYRRKLLLLARKGDSQAQGQLMEKYGMRVYSDTERAKMLTYYDSGRKGSAPSLTPNRIPASTCANSVSQGKPRRSAEAKKPAKTAAEARRKKG